MNDALTDLGRWNEALLARYFPEVNEPKVVRFAVDDGELEEIRKAHSLHQPLHIAMRAVMGADPTKLDFESIRFRLIGTTFESGPTAAAPWYLALLAMQVLAASHMVRDGECSATAFWPRFRELFAMNRLPSDPLREWLSGLWAWFSNYLTTSCASKRGTLGLPADPTNIPYAKKRHVNLPLSQVLVRLADRKPLAELFDKDDFQDLTGDELVKRLVALPALQVTLSVPLRGVLRQAKSDPGLAASLAEIFDEIRKEPITERRDAIRGQGGKRRVGAARDRVTRIYLVRDEFSGLFRLDAILERSDGEILAERPSLTLAEFFDGFSWGIEEARWRPSGTEPFLQREGSLVTGVRYIREESDRITLLLRDEDVAALMPRLANSGGIKQLRLEGELAGGTLVTFPAGDFWGTQLFDELGLRCLGGKPALIGGLKVISNRERIAYLIEAPPALWIPGAGSWQIDCTLPSGQFITLRCETRTETVKRLVEVVDPAEMEPGRYRVAWSRLDQTDYVAQERTFVLLCASVEDVAPRAGPVEVGYVIDPVGEAFSSLRLPSDGAERRVVVGARIVSVSDR